MEVSEDIADEHRPHAKYMGTVYPYLPNSYGSSYPGWPEHRALAQTWVSAIIIYPLCK